MDISSQSSNVRQPILIASSSARSGVGLSVLSVDCVEITAGRNSNLQSQRLEDDEEVTVDQSLEAANRHYPLDSSTGLPLKGILKQRSMSGMACPCYLILTSLVIFFNEGSQTNFH